MRIPNLNVSQSVTQKIRDLDLERFKLDKQITTGQKISLPEDDGLSMSRVIQLDSTKSRLAQYQRNASYATEFINSGHLNLEKLREINQRAQEIARLAGSNLNGPAVEAYGLEIDQLIEEALNRVNATQRGRSLFGGTELKPDFSHSDVVLGKMERKILDLNANSIGVSEREGARYLKQGDELLLRANGREYVIQASVDQVSLYNSDETYNQGDFVYTVESAEKEDGIIVDQLPGRYPTMNAVREHLQKKDWSKSPVGNLLASEGGSEVYELSYAQIEQLSVSLGGQMNVDFFPKDGGYFALVENNDGSILLEPVVDEVGLWNPSKKYAQGEFVKWGVDLYRSKDEIEVGVDFSDIHWEKMPPGTVANTFKLSNYEQIHYWEALRDSPSIRPGFDNADWVNVNPFEWASNLSLEKATEELRNLINEDPFFLSDSTPKITTDYTAFVRSSGQPGDFHNDDIKLRAKVLSSGKLEVTGTVGEPFKLEANYSSRYDTRNYFPLQLERMLEDQAKSMYPVTDFDSLNDAEKESVWRVVRDSVLTWDLNVSESFVDGDSNIKINLSEPWKRLEVYKAGDVVQFDNKLWESKKSENFNHLPNHTNSDYWKEVGNGYSVDREDWNFSNIGSESRLFWTSPDGKLFDSETDAFSHTTDIITRNAQLSPEGSEGLLDAFGNIDNDLVRNKVASSIRQIAYPVNRFDVDGSESNGVVYFNAIDQSYRLAVQDSDENPIDGFLPKGKVYSIGELNSVPEVAGESLNGSMVQYRGSYYALTNDSPAFENPDNPDDPSIFEKTFDSDGNLLSIKNQVEGVIYSKTFSDSLNVGEKFYDENSGKVFMFTGGSLPIEGNEPFIQPGVGRSVRSGSYVYLSDAKPTESSGDRSGFYLATDDISDVSLGNHIDPSTGVPPVDSSKLIRLSAYASPQGSEWSASKTYDKGQVVLHAGVYYECQTSGVDGLGFDNFSDETVEIIALGNDGTLELQNSPVVVSPSDDFFKSGLSDARSQEFIDLQKAKGEPINNNVWLPVSNPLKHVFSFDVSSTNSHNVEIAPAGSNGSDASVSVLSDIDGNVFGLRVDDPGRYYFPQTSDAQKIPEEYRTAFITMNDGQSLEARILWDENPNDPGPYIISGFELLGDSNIKTDIQLGSSKGDSFSLATGTKTFLDHRDAEGNVIGLTYTGSEKNAEFFVGNNSKISSFLDANNGNTKELADVVNSLIELREGLSINDLTDMAQTVQAVEQNLIDQENSVVDKMGELSSSLIRMNTVRAHDEDYHLEINQRLAKDLDIDLSEAIMQLTRVSTAYQAAMQVGAQLLNTSLLNYL
jgi:flagellin-like hook-associated protein FlgL